MTEEARLVLRKNDARRRLGELRKERDTLRKRARKREGDTWIADSLRSIDQQLDDQRVELAQLHILLKNDSTEDVQSIRRGEEVRREQRALMKQRREIDRRLDELREELSRFEHEWKNEKLEVVNRALDEEFSE